jgi:hypothetical protein
MADLHRSVLSLDLKLPQRPEFGAVATRLVNDAREQDTAVRERVRAKRHGKNFAHAERISVACASAREYTLTVI